MSKTMFKTVSCHQEYFNVLSLSSYMDHGRGKDPCDPIGVVWWRERPILQSKMTRLLSKMPMAFLHGHREQKKQVPSDFLFVILKMTQTLSHFWPKLVKTLNFQLKLCTVLPHAANKISERDTSYFKGSFQQDTTCEGRRLVNLIETSV